MSCSTYCLSAISGDALLAILFRVSKRHETSSREPGICKTLIISTRIAKEDNPSVVDVEDVLEKDQLHVRLYEQNEPTSRPSDACSKVGQPDPCLFAAAARLGGE